MKYGFFDDANREYVITAPATPLPWINYLGTRDFFSIISNTAGGYSFFRDARLRRITRYRYNSVPTDSLGRYFYINDNGDLWSPGWKPVRSELDAYRCRHGLGYTIIDGRRNGLSAESLFFVPVEGWCEVQRVRLRNDTRRSKSFHLFSYVEFCLWNALDDMTNLQRNLSTGEVEVEGSVIYHKTEYRERRNHFAFYAVNAPVAGFDTDRDAFLGPYGGYDRPLVPSTGRSSGSLASGWSPVASHHIACSLQPGEARDFVFLLGYVENAPEGKWSTPGVINKEGAHRLIKRFTGSEEVERELANLRAHWEGLLARFRVESPDERLDRMVNTWNQYQCVVTFNMSRSASLFETGIGRGVGFRDTNQDLLGCMHQIPEAARRRILDVAATQFPDGGAYHQYQPLTKRGNNEVGGNFNDDPLWLILSVCAYIKETGDWAILDEAVPFAEQESAAAAPGSRGSPPILLDHLRASFAHTSANLGPHALPLIGRADWNDCLNLNTYSTNPDESFQTTTTRDGKVAESVFIAGLFVVAGRELAALLARRGLARETEAALAQARGMEKAVIDHGWDGSWYLRAYDDSGHKVGSRECEEGRIYIEPQGFCAMAQIGAERGFPQRALDSVKEHLDTPYGIMIFQPAYSGYHVELGEVSSYPPGYKENAGVFCHNNPWVMIGESLLGRGNRAFEYYRKIAPAYIEETGLHRTEPYVYSQMIAGRDSKRQGEAKNSWLTGTAAWNFVAVSQWILGIRPDYDGLLVDPCLPEHLRAYRVTRRFRGATYRIAVANPLGLEKGRVVLTVDGRPTAGNRIPLLAEGKDHEIAVSLERRE